MSLLIILLLVITQDNGNDDDIPLAQTIISGTISKCSYANNLPVLPNPDCISSIINKI